MIYTDVQQIALAILTSIITGGFVLVFVEIGNRKNRENDKYDQIMTPFMHKLSAYFRFMNWCGGQILYPHMPDEYEIEYKKLVSEVSGYGSRAIISGGDYGVGHFTADELYKIAFDINNIWYYHDKMHPCRLTWDVRFSLDGLISKELKEINPVYLKENVNVGLVAKVSGEFYTDIYQPIESETYKHEAYKAQYGRQTVFVVLSVLYVLLVLSLMLFYRLSVNALQLTAFCAIVLLIVSLLLLAVDVRKQIKWWSRIESLKDKMKALKFKPYK